MTTTKSNKEIDSILEEALKKRVSDISWSINKAQEALKLSQENNYAKGVAYANSYIGFFYMIITKHKEAIPYVEAANVYFEAENDKFGLAFNYNTIGSIHYKTDDYHFGLKKLLKAYYIYQELNDIASQARTLKSIGAIYEFFKDYKKAKETYLTSIKLCESVKDIDGISNALNPLSGLYLKEGDILNASKTINRAVVLKKESQDVRGLGFALHGLAKVNEAQKDFKKAESTYIESLKIHEKLDENVGKMMTLNKLGNLYYKIGDFEASKQRLKECLKAGEKSHLNLVIYKAYHTLYLIEKEENNIAEAFINLEQHNLFKERVQKRDIEHVLKSVQSLSKIEMLENEAKWQKEKTEEVERKNKELDNFVYKVSHDLRGPISSLLGLHHIASLDVKDEKSLKYFNMYHEQIKRLESIILDFIDLTRLKESNTIRSLINFDKIIAQCIKSYNYLSNFDNIKFNISIEKGLSFYSDRSSINSILQNLIENAIKYSDPSKEPFVNVSITSNAEIQQLIITVADNGIGIPENFKSNIFDMFFRANDTIQGSGLGLYILKTAVDRIQGKIHFESTIGTGSTFEIRLPLTK